ncbi:rhodanese-like domain-containing protein [Myceligenerans pegani]|uniref:Rhodanese-like domain-containing protein n=1 Tax=Myceligenerans pegani TaxID=2776917 RepID=A0ABR9MU03_9MICO|nr:rhodanese-like domain-containing protein [Myceligenerans sp. TRM 65318]MBE1874434.1 rhodanese-like domain-containing protein [Myceligenerans sp. TRM 65318]MBE3016705.1 rhodanese-like domain-containing protein [Myceligenerans sp. TRM 65318]
MTITPDPTPYDPTAAVAHFGRRLAFETDVADVHAALSDDRTEFTLLDVRSPEAWDAGHLPGALHLPGGKIRLRAERTVPRDMPVVVYCWGPGCNAATKAAHELAKQGYEVKEMLGGFEYWVREGFAYDTATGRIDPAADPLAAVPGTN